MEAGLSAKAAPEMARKVVGVNEASSKLRTCIATVSIAGDFREKLGAISRAGFTGIEIFEQDFLAYDGRAVDVGWLVQDYGLENHAVPTFSRF